MTKNHLPTALLLPSLAMESSCCIIEEPSAESTAPPPPPPLRRLGSGGSAVLDPPAGDAADDAESGRKLPSSRYKGVVPQPNGRWGAQIYERHQRVWLGTFADEAAAARSYDAAAQRFRGRDAATNFPPLSESNPDGAAELAFLAAHSKAEVVDMLRKHTYLDEFRQSRRAPGPGARWSPAPASSAWRLAARELLFDKVVTPSDVGKLNRLVIPKQHAEKHFPLGPSDGGAAAGCKGLLLNFQDGNGKVWRFRYSYWNSSQSYVLTKGWSRFVKEKGLRAGDSVSFLMSSSGPEKQLYIECRKKAAAAAVRVGGEIARPWQAVRLFGVNIVTAAAQDEQKLANKRQCLGLGAL